MKKLALIVASLALLATPAFACPHEDGKKASDEQTAPKTADKAKAKDAPKAKEADKTKTAKPTEKTPEKKPDKVSQK